MPRLPGVDGGRASRRDGGRVPDDLPGVERVEERGCHVRVELCAGTLPDLVRSVLRTERRAIRTAGRHRVERVGDREDPALEGDRRARSTGRVAEPVPALVMEEHVRERGVERRHPGDQPHALDRMRADLGELALVEPTRLGEHLRADVDLADVVERRTEPERFEALLVPAQPDGDGLRVRGDARGVRAERGVADLHGGRIGGESNHGISGSPHAPGTLPVDSVGRCECACPGSPRPANTGLP